MMRKTGKRPVVKIIRGSHPATRKLYCAEDKIRTILDGLPHDVIDTIDTRSETGRIHSGVTLGAGSSSGQREI